MYIGDVSHHQQDYQYTYKIKCGEFEKVVCREGFASLHGIGVKRVRRVAQLTAHGTTPNDKRGKHSKQATKSDDIKLKIDAHITSFPYRVSHYGGHGNKRRYLSADLNVLKMFTMFLSKHYPEYYAEYKAGKDPQKLQCDVKYRYYFNYYKENFNYGFGRPKTDICTVCAELEASIKLSKNVGEKNTLTAKLDLHKRKAKVFYKQLKEKSAAAKKNMDTECLCFDFKQNMPYPHIATSDVFYSRQHWLFVFGIYSAKTGKSRIYTWPETKARRGVNEVVSCLDDYITKYLDPTVHTLHVFTDGCRGQNHNNTMVQYLHSLVLNKRLDSVTHRLPMRGHSYLPCDREFGVIERMQKRRDHIETFTEWDDMLRERFEVTSMEGRQMKDFKGILGKFYKTNAKDWKITKYKVFKYSSKTNLEIITCEDMNARQEQKFLLLKSSFRKIVYPTDSLYTRPCAINSKKVKDVQSLARYLLREDSREYMKSLTEKMPCGMAGEDSDYEE